MQVAVETFECQETASEPIEASEEALDIIDELDLEGQRAFIAVTKQAHTTRCPYRRITAEEWAVYKTLCPESESLTKYARSPIPLRVLQIAAHAMQTLPKTSKIKLKVWDKESPLVHDPVLVAFVGEYDFRADDCFILARWGTELEAFAVLAKKAAEMIREKATGQLEHALAMFKGCPDSVVLKNFEFAVNTR